MKHILVVCNNPPEWKHFVDVATWNLSKQNKPYKLSGDALFDVQNNQEFIHVPNNMYKLSEKLYIFGDDFRIDLIIPMCNIDKEVRDYLELFIGGSMKYTPELVGSGQFGICSHCNLPPTPEGHDGCLGTLSGNVMNACCGHGREDLAYIQYWSGDIIRGSDAIIEQGKIEERSE